MLTNINQSYLFISSPLEQFDITSLLSFNAPLLGYINLTLTNLALYTLLLFLLIVSLHIVANNNIKLLPSKWIFLFILIANLIGNIPYSYAITSSIIVSIGLSFTIVIGVTILGLSIHKIHFFSFFIPSGTPLALIPLLVLIELISYIARAFSLGIRLFSNITAGHTLLKILSTFLYQMFTGGVLIAIVTLIPFALFLAIIGLELAVSFIQAYVFTLLLLSYIKDAIDLH